MTAASAIEHLTPGLGSDEAAARVRLVESAFRVFGGQTGRSSAAHAGWVPGRLEVLGTHTDYAGGRALVGALPRGFVFVSAPRSDGRVVVTDARDGTRVAAEAAGAPAWSRYVSAVVARLRRNFPGAMPGADVVFISDLPRASGMSSSSALLTGLTISLAHAFDLVRRDEWLASIHTTHDLAQYCASIENGSSFGELAGDAGVGTLGGCEDHAAILLTRAGQLSAFAFMPLRHLGDVRLPEAWRFVVATSGVAASKSGAERDAYNRLSRGVARLLDLWNRHEPEAASLAAALASRPDAGDRLRAIVAADAAAGQWPADALERRLAHFEIEDALVPDAVRAVECGDETAIGAIAEASQQRAELLLGNQVPETIALTRLAREHGAFAARSFGAGFGGSVWALVGRNDASAFADRWLHSYRQNCPAGAAAEAFVAPLGAGVTS